MHIHTCNQSIFPVRMCKCDQAEISNPLKMRRATQYSYFNTFNYVEIPKDVFNSKRAKSPFNTNIQSSASAQNPKHQRRKHRRVTHLLESGLLVCIANFLHFQNSARLRSEIRQPRLRLRVWTKSNDRCTPSVPMVEQMLVSVGME